MTATIYAPREARETSQAVSVPICAVVLHRALPRDDFEPDELKALADSMNRDGLLQRPIARQLEDGRYELLSGARRFRAWELLGCSELPVTLWNVSDVEAIRIVGAEQLIREDWNALQIAEYLRMLCTPLDDGGAGMTHALAGEMLGQSRTWASEYLSLLKLPESIQQRIVDGSMPMRNARLFVSHIGNQKVFAALLKDMERNPHWWSSTRIAEQRAQAILAAVARRGEPRRQATVRFSRTKIEKFLRPWASNERYLRTIIEIAQAMLASREREHV